MDAYTHLFSPGKIGTLYLKNRIVMAPLGSRLTTENGGVTDDMIEFYSQRALGGVGAVTIEAMGISYPQAVGKPGHTRFCSDIYMPGHAKLVERIHERGSKAFAMLWHAGINKGCLDGVTPVGPSAILNPNTGIIPHELTVKEIHEIVDQFADAALRAQLCGYDAVSLHAAHGYLISSFVSKATNKRTDEYGGSFENRTRFAMEIVAAIRKKVGNKYPIIARINGDDFIEGGITLDEATSFAQALERAGVDGLDISAGVYGSIDTMIEPIQYTEGWKLYLPEHIRKHVHIPVFGVGVIHSPEVAEKALADGQVDFVSLGRELLCEPQWANKVRAGERHYPKCIGCNACFERIGKNLPLRCAINPLAGRELHVPAPAKAPKRIAVVGGGPGGVTAAVTAAGRGHVVELFESEKRIGGQLLLAGTPPHKEKILDYVEYLEEELARSSVRLHLGKSFVADMASEFDEVVLCTGAGCRDMLVPGSESCRMTAWDALRLENSRFAGKHVMVVGAGSVGCETALYIQKGGAKSVAITELRSKIAADMDNISRMALMHELKEAKVGLFPAHVLDSVAEGSGTLRNVDSDETQSVPCDLVVIAVGSLPEATLAEELYAKGISFYTVGDAQRIGKIGDAVRGGFDAVAAI